MRLYYPKNGNLGSLEKGDGIFRTGNGNGKDHPIFDPELEGPVSDDCVSGLGVVSSVVVICVVIVVGFMEGGGGVTVVVVEVVPSVALASIQAKSIHLFLLKEDIKRTCVTRHGKSK